MAEYLDSIGGTNRITSGGGGGEEWRSLLEAAFSARFAGVDAAGALPPAVLLYHEQPAPVLQAGSTQGAAQGLGHMFGCMGLCLGRCIRVELVLG